MAKSKGVISLKRVQINKDATKIVVSVGMASFLFVFMLIAGQALISQLKYQNKVISQKEDARDQLEVNIKAAGELKTKYLAFQNAPVNIIGGTPTGNGPNDGDNAKLTLDSLPSKYDFPALLSSIEKLLTENGYGIESIEGKDQEVENAKNDASVNPTPVEMPLEVSAKTNNEGVKKLINLFERSIRPFNVTETTIAVEGETNIITITHELKSYFQPSKKLEIKTQEVK